jgi:hypothetical protein
MHNTESKTAPNSQIKALEQRIKHFVTGLKKDFGPLIAQDQSSFRSCVVGKVRAGLPRKRPGRRGSPEVQRAAEIYLRDYKSQGKTGNWHSIAKQVISNYLELRPELRTLHRMSLRANVHSFLYEERSRQKRSKEVPLIRTKDDGKMERAS